MYLCQSGADKSFVEKKSDILNCFSRLESKVLHWFPVMTGFVTLKVTLSVTAHVYLWMNHLDTGLCVWPGPGAALHNLLLNLHCRTFLWSSQTLWQKCLSLHTRPESGDGEEGKQREVGRREQREGREREWGEAMEERKGIRGIRGAGEGGETERERWHAANREDREKLWDSQRDGQGRESASFLGSAEEEWEQRLFLLSVFLSFR